jgi:hypothetical protein
MSGAKGQREGWCGDLSIIEIRALRRAGMTIAEIAERAGVCWKTIQSACSRHRIVSSWGGSRYRGQAVPPNEEPRTVFATALTELPFLALT